MILVLDVRSRFGLPSDRIWLNAAHQGPLPRSAADAVSEMVEWKLQPHHLQTPQAFTDLPRRLREAIAKIVGARSSEIVLANSASYGLHLVANGLDLVRGDEVVVAANDFPSDVLPWLRLERDGGVEVRQVEPAGPVPTVDEIAAAMGRRTRVVCLTWVHSFSGHVVDLDAVGQLCRDVDALFVVNGSQGVGAIPISANEHPIDVLVGVGFKWLCGPYGTGFCWLGPRARQRIRPNKIYWLDVLTTEDLEHADIDLRSIADRAQGSFDIFGTANFFNFAGLEKAVESIDDIGVSVIYEHNQRLASLITDGLDRDKYELQDRGTGLPLSSILFIRPIREDLPDVVRRLHDARIDVAVRSGMIRLSPHLYNTPTEIGRLTEALIP